MIRELNGDLFEFKADALAHGCNSRGLMDDGIAMQFRLKYPDMYKEYVGYCKIQLFDPGDIHFYRSREKGKPHVINLCTQLEPSGGARLEHITQALEKVKQNYKTWGIKSLAMPRIGCGLGGLEWKDVREVFCEVLNDSDLDVLVAQR